MAPFRQTPGEFVNERIETRIEWPRDRPWRPGEPITLTVEGRVVTYRLRGVMRDADPVSAFATVVLEPVREVAVNASPEQDRRAG